MGCLENDITSSQKLTDTYIRFLRSDRLRKCSGILRAIVNAHEELIAQGIRLLPEKLGIMPPVFDEFSRDNWDALVNDGMVQRKELGQIVREIVVVIDAEDGAVANNASSVPQLDVESTAQLQAVVHGIALTSNHELARLV